jgi:threonine/homoserine/homoserine lactone efflux protein
MLIALLAGAILGFVLALPPGPIAMVCIRMGIEKGRAECFQLSLGTAAMDMVYSFIAIFAAAAVQSAASTYLDDNPIVSVFFQVIVVIGLVYYGFVQFKKQKKAQENPEARKKQSQFIEGLKKKGPLMLGIALALTNLANPTFLPSLAVMSGWVHKMNIFQNAVLENSLFAVGFGIGNFIWLYLLAYMVMRNKHKLSDNSITYIKQFAGITFIGFGGFIGWRMFAFTNWAQVVKILFAV